jgi:predicted DNA-binding protein
MTTKTPPRLTAEDSYPVTVRLTNDTRAELRKLSEETDTRPSVLIREAVEALVASMNEEVLTEA